MSLIVCLIVFSAAPQVRPISSAVRRLLWPVRSQAMKIAAAARELGDRDVNVAMSFTLLAMKSASFLTSFGKFNFEQNRS